MKKILMVALVLIFLLGFSITYVKGPAYAEKVGKVIDRVCKMQIIKEEAKRLKKNGHTYFFCSKSCKKAFKKDPAKYACICPPVSDGCECGHCTGNGEICECAEMEMHVESHSGKHDSNHEDDEGGGHHH